MTSRDLTSRKEVIELFCGAGGFTWGWNRAGFVTRAAIDHDVAATRTHELNFPHTLTLHRDLTAFQPEDLVELLGGRGRGLLAVVGGPPCQGWSKAGRGKLRSLDSTAESLLRDPRNQLYRRFLDFVRHLRPPICVMENVPGMMSIEGRNVAETVRTHFANIGYRCSVELVNARWFGVPQDRRRLIFLCVRDGLDLQLSASRLERFAARFRRDTLRLPADDTSVRQAIGDLPEVEHGSQEDPRPYCPPRSMSRYAQFMRERSNGMITDHVTKWHNAQDLEAFESMPEGGLYRDLDQRFKRYRDDIFPDKYRKLRWDAPAGTVTAHLAKDAYTHIHPEQPRTVSIREAARFQSFPDDFRFFGNWGERFRQIGNAVPPLMAYGIADFIREQIELTAGC
jgi:DNA (cytosine-5)-methyltransferase 1